MKTRITALILIISCLFSLCSCQTEPTIEKETSTYQITRYVLDLTGIDFTPYLADAEMEIEKKNKSEFAYIKLHLYFKKAEEVTNILKAETNMDDAPYIRIPAFKNHRYRQELMDMPRFTGHYITVKTGGSLTESRHIDIYTCNEGVDNGREYYVYIFG